MAHEEVRQSDSWAQALGYATAILLLAVPALLQLELRPLHNDEAVNHFFLERTASLGYYPYSHENYHGPLYFYYLFPFFMFVGEDVFTLRFSNILITLLALALLWGYRGVLGARTCVGAAVLISLSSSLFYYRRYAIHETFFVLAGLFLALAMLRWLGKGRGVDIFVGALALAALIALKETWIITLFALGVATLCCIPPAQLLSALRAQLTLFMAGIFFCAALCVSIFSGFFVWSGGLREMVLAIPQWVARSESDIGHHKPFGYYTEMLLSEEPHLVIGICVVAVLAVFYRQLRSDIALRFFAVWAVVTFLVYSWVSYKTPWLVMNVSLPLCLVVARASLEQSMLPTVLRRSYALAVVLLLGYSLERMYDWNFVRPTARDNPFAYVHTEMDVFPVLETISEYRAERGSARVLVGISQHWPLPYYLRESAREGFVAYLADARFADHSSRYDILILDPRHSAMPAPPAGWQRQAFTFSHVQPAELWVRKISYDSNAVRALNGPIARQQE